MNKKRFLVSLMVLTMSMGAFVGCSSKGEPAAEKVLKNTTTQQETGKKKWQKTQ